LVNILGTTMVKLLTLLLCDKTSWHKAICI
jgi:hypothetical protein